MLSEGIPPEGRVGFVNKILTPDNQRTMAYSDPIAHPVNKDDYIWYYGEYADEEKTSLSQDDAIAAGWAFATEA